MKPIIVMNC